MLYKHTKLFFLLLTFYGTIYSQDLPTNPETGKCYERIETPDLWINENLRIEVAPAYKKLKVSKVKLQIVEDTVLVKSAHNSKNPNNIWIKDTIYFDSKNYDLRVIPARFSITSQTIEIKPATAKWGMSDTPAADCASSNPDDCRYWCYKGIPSEDITVSVRELVSDARIERIENQKNYYIRQVLKDSLDSLSFDTPAIYETIKRTVVSNEPTIKETQIPAEVKTIKKEVLYRKGGLTTWVERDCNLVEYKKIPVKWDNGSAKLSEAFKRNIDNTLIPIFRDNIGGKIEITSHTDSKETSASSQVLSERRSQAIENYLISKGVNPKLFYVKGYGETKLINRCVDGEDCTEVEHSINNRTEFKYDKLPLNLIYDNVYKSEDGINAYYVNEDENIIKRDLYTDKEVIIDVDYIELNTIETNFPLGYNLDTNKIQFFEKNNYTKVLAEIKPKGSFFSDVRTIPNSPYVAVSENGKTALFFKKNQELAFEFDFDGLINDWSSDGNILLLFKTSSSDGHVIDNSEIYTYNLRTKQISQITNTDSIIEFDPKFLDDNTIQYINLESGKKEIIDYYE